LYLADPERLKAIAAGLKPYEVKDRPNQPGVFKLPQLPDLELRIGGYKPDGTVKQLQSVVPPSIGADGKPRVWNGVETVAALPEATYAFLERIVAEVKAKSNGTQAAGPVAPQRTANQWIMDCLTDDATQYLKTAIKNAVARIEAAAPGTRRDTYRDEAYCLAGYLHYGIGYTEHELATQLKSALARGVSLDDRVKDEAVDDAIAAGKAAPRDLKPELHQIAIAARNGHGGTKGTAQEPTIIISPELHKVIDQAVTALSADREIYQRGGVLVRIVRDPIRDKRLNRPPDTPRIVAVPPPTLRERLTRFAVWKKYKQDRSGKAKLVSTIPSDAIVSGVAARAEWSKIRPLETVIEAPTLRPDGSVLDVPGYDGATGVLYLPNAEFPPIPDQPTREDAEQAAKLLLALVADFPFAVVIDAQGNSDGGASHRAVWLAALLTVLVRIAIDGPTPLTVFDASTPGAGKTLLAENIALIAFGRALARTPYSEDDAELRKAITSIAMAGDRLVLLDNVASAFGGSALDAALTATVWRDRRLGTNELTLLPLSVVWLASGNNVAFKGDVLRRILHCRLEPSDENPEERDPSTFQIKEPLDRHVLRRRAELVAAALTIVRAYHIAGRPAQKLPSIDFRSWSDLVRNAVFWATGADPCATRKALVATDTASADRAALVDGWAELPGADKGLTTAEALKKLDENQALYAALRSALTTRKGELMTARSIGMRLNAIRGRVINGKSINGFDAGKNTHAWKVVTHASGGTKRTSGTDYTYAREKNGDSYSGKRDRQCETVPPVHLVPPGEGGTDPQNGAGRERFSL
jgi:hypothetical protein